MKYNDKNKPLECIMTNSTCYKKTHTMEIKGILWHSTGANNPNLKRYVQPSADDKNYSSLMKKIGTNTNKNSWNQITNYAGVNAFIGKLADGTIATVQTLPWNYRPWGCAGGRKGSCNDNWIQFEICEDGLDDKDYFEKVYKEACELTAYLCMKYDIDPKGTVTYNGIKVPTILCHWDSYELKLGSGHVDVYHWFKKYDKTMVNVRNDVAKLIEDANKPDMPSESFIKKETNGATTLVKYNGEYWAVKDNKIITDNTLVEYKDVWWHVNGGKLVRDNTLVKFNGTWWNIKNGKVSYDEELVQYNNRWFYMKDGKMCKDDTLVKRNNTYYHVKDGEWVKDTCLIQYGKSTWYVKDGICQNGFTGIATIPAEFKVVDGRVQL